MKTVYVAEKDLGDLSARWTVPVGKRYYADVFVWKSKEGLFRNTGWRKKEYAGAYIGYPHRNGRGLFGEVHILRDKIGAGYVSHELMHLVFDWMDRRGMREFTSGMSLNERCAYLMSDMTSAFWNKFYENYDVVPSADGKIVPDDR